VELCDVLKIQNITPEKVCNKGMTFKDTKTADATKAVYEYHFLLVVYCYNISI